MSAAPPPMFRRLFAAAQMPGRTLRASVEMTLAWHPLAAALPDLEQRTRGSLAGVDRPLDVAGTLARVFSRSTRGASSPLPQRRGALRGLEVGRPRVPLPMTASAAMTAPAVRCIQVGERERIAELLRAVEPQASVAVDPRSAVARRAAAMRSFLRRLAATPQRLPPVERPAQARLPAFPGGFARQACGVAGSANGWSDGAGDGSAVAGDAEAAVASPRNAARPPGAASRADALLGAVLQAQHADRARTPRASVAAASSPVDPPESSDPAAAAPRAAAAVGLRGLAARFPAQSDAARAGASSRTAPVFARSDDATQGDGWADAGDRRGDFAGGVGVAELLAEQRQQALLAARLTRLLRDQAAQHGIDLEGLVR